MTWSVDFAQWIQETRDLLWWRVVHLLQWFEWFVLESLAVVWVWTPTFMCCLEGIMIQVLQWTAPNTHTQSLTRNCAYTQFATRPTEAVAKNLIDSGNDVVALPSTKWTAHRMWKGSGEVPETVYFQGACEKFNFPVIHFVLCLDFRVHSLQKKQNKTRNLKDAEEEPEWSAAESCSITHCAAWPTHPATLKINDLSPYGALLSLKVPKRWMQVGRRSRCRAPWSCTWTELMMEWPTPAK